MTKFHIGYAIHGITPIKIHWLHYVGLLTKNQRTQPPPPNGAAHFLENRKSCVHLLPTTCVQIPRANPPYS